MYEAIGERDQRVVIAKVFDIEDEADEDRVQHEFELIRSLDIEGVVEALELRRVGDQLVLLLERVPGNDLAEFAGGQPLELDVFWPIATQIADILAQTHAAGVIHRDIKPTNILIDPSRERVWLADFGISVLLENEQRHIYDGDVFVGTLPYISPEQTGRTGHAVDFRSDLYSLGVTFYELLTGRGPFEGMAPLELIHAHLAQLPKPPATLRAELPAGLSRLVMKLLAKAPEHRYQTAAGLAADLRRLRALIDAGEPSEGFELGREDRSTTLRLPHQLFGHAVERAAIADALAGVAGSGTRQTLALTGPLGIGKSAVVDELGASIAGYGGTMVRGEFGVDREQPYSGFARAFTDLFEQLLTESDARLERWRRLLIEGLGGLVGVLVELAPTLELIVGPQPVAAPLEGVEGRNRLVVAVERLLAVVCTAEGPLVLVLEDLDRVDQGSLHLIDALAHGQQGPLLLLLTVREPAPEPVQVLLAALAGRPRSRRITLTGLTSTNIEALLHAALPGAVELDGLARIIARKTNGVPLFVRQWLTQLAERGLVRVRHNEWVWDRDGVEAEPIPADAVAMTRAKLETLHPATRELIRCAACIGGRFDLHRLTLVSERERSEIGSSLVELEDAGLLDRVGGGYRFAHDSIRAAALLGVDAEARRRLHWTLGRELQRSLADSNEALFEVVDHLDAGAPIELDPDLRLELAELDLRAGKRALDAAAYDLARTYLDHGIALTTELAERVRVGGSATPGYELSFQLHFTFGRTLALAGRRREADAWFVDLLAWPLEDHHYAKIVGRRLDLLWTETRYGEAVALGKAALERLGAALPSSIELSDALASIERAWAKFQHRDCAAVRALPACEDEREIAILEVVAQLEYPSFPFDNRLFLYLVGLHAELIDRHGYHPSAAKAVADLAVGVSGALGRVAEGVVLLDLGCELARLEPRGSSEARLLAVAGPLSLHRGRGFADILASFEVGYPHALEAGEFDVASFLGNFGAHMQFEVGVHLRVLDRRARRVTRDVGRWSPNQMRAEAYVLRGLCHALLGAELDPDDALEGTAIWDLDPEQVLVHGGARPNFYAAHIGRALVELIFDQPAAALTTLLRILHDVDQVIYNFFFVARAHLLGCVAHCVQALAGEPSAGHAEQVGKSLDLLARWAEDCPANYQHYLDLARGLDHAVRGEHPQAATLLDRAWQAARKQGCRWIEGLAAEQLAAEFERQGLHAAVEGLWQRAWDAFAAWGAEAKLQRMRAAHPTLFSESSRRTGGERTEAPTHTPTTYLGSRSISTPPLDLARVLRSVGAITEDLRLEEVISRLLDAALTNVGADHGLLVLDQGGELTLVAEATAGDRSVFADPPLLRDAGDRAPSTLIHFVTRMGHSVVLDDARQDLRFAGDPYLEHTDVRSVLALPLIKGERRLGVLVLENHLTTHGFGATSLEALRLITSQAASTLENAQLYSALRRSEARWRSLVDGAPDLIALFDERGEVVFRNHGGPLLGLGERDEGGGALRPESALRWQTAIETVLAEGQRCELELEFVPHLGPERWYAVRIAPIELHRALGRAADMVRRNAVAVATDISARKQAEAEKRVLEAQLRQQQRLESVGTLASGVAHEINNPIQGIMNYAELIQASVLERELVEDFASEITRESRRVAKIVRNLLAFSRQDATEEPEPVQLAAVVESSLSLVHAVLRSDHIRVEVEAQPGLPPVLCRAQQIQQVVMNLVTNARDALNERYDAYDDRKQITIRVESSAREDWVRVAVRDSGSGIPPEVLPRIFDPFFTTKGRDQGTGLGLAVSHGIVRDHGGELGVETELGVGTCVSLELPAFVLAAQGVESSSANSFQR